MARPVAGGTPEIHLLRGRQLEVATLLWNCAGVAVLAFAAAAARSVALAGFGLDSLIEIGASAVVLWELAATSRERQHRAMRMIGIAFILLSLYLAAQSTVVLVLGFRPHHSPVGIAWTAATALVMLLLARGKAATGRALGNQVLLTEGRITLIDAFLAAAVLSGLLLNAFLGWWWADPAAGYILLYYSVREARESLLG